MMVRGSGATLDPRFPGRLTFPSNQHRTSPRVGDELFWQRGQTNRRPSQCLKTEESY
jgi:hypothetical protein